MWFNEMVTAASGCSVPKKAVKAHDKKKKEQTLNRYQTILLT